MRVGGERACLLPAVSPIACYFGFCPQAMLRAEALVFGGEIQKPRDREAGRKQDRQANVPSNCLPCTLGPYV